MNFAIACYRMPYLAIVHLNYCLDFSTNSKIGLLKPRSTGIQARLLSSVHCIKHKLNKCGISPIFAIWMNIRTNQMFVATLVITSMAHYIYMIISLAKSYNNLWWHTTNVILWSKMSTYVAIAYIAT